MTNRTTDKTSQDNLEPQAAAGLVPDTLDLAEHGRMGINGILGGLNPALDYESVFLTFLDVHPAYMAHWSSMVSGVMPKYIECLLMLRLMSGSRQDMDIEKGFFDSLIRNMADDGLIYDRALPSRPWNVGVFYGKRDWNEDYANMAGNARALVGLLGWHQVTGDPAWMQRARRTAERLLELAVVEGDLAWYPNPGCGNDFSYPRTSGWTTREPPKSAGEGAEGGAMFYQLLPLRGFARYYQATGDERFLDLSRKFARLGLQEKFWPGSGVMDPIASAERGHFGIHFHCSMAAIRSVLDYALAANDQRAKEWAHSAYLYGRQMGVQRLGLFPTNIGWTEGCSTADMIGMAIALTDAGLGDYWDDAETYARNGLVSEQATDLEELQRVSSEGRERPPYAPWRGVFDELFGSKNNKGRQQNQEIHDRVLERTIGAFGHLMGACYQTPMMMSCCTANCTQALYYAWEGIVRREGEGAAVNLWLNRRSPWVDVWSHLPHQGMLVVRNKTAKRVSIRQPGWAQRSRMRCQLDGREVVPEWRGNRMVFEGLRGGELIAVQAPLGAEKVDLTMVNIRNPQQSIERYRLEFKGHTALGVELLTLPKARRQAAEAADSLRASGGGVPMLSDEDQLAKNEAGWTGRSLAWYQFFGDEVWPGRSDRTWYRIFRREAMRAEQARLKAAPDYVHPEKLLRWTVT